MKFASASTLLVAALVSVLSAVPRLSDLRQVEPDARLFVLRVRMASRAPGRVQLYWNGGRGYQESDSSVLPIAPGDEPGTYRLAIPMGTYAELRFDPIDNDGRVLIDDAAIVDAQDRVLREIPLGDFEALNQIRSLGLERGRLTVDVTPGGNDPQLLVRFRPPLVVDVAAGPFWAEAREALRLSLRPFAAILAALLALEFLPALRRGASRLLAWLGRRPGLAVACVAAASAAASSYPVLFLGESFVSPEMEYMTLLYDGHPTLPGGSVGRVTRAVGSDIGAILWQHIPLAQVERRALGRAEAPYWNRYNGCGVPLIGQGQSMVGDPLNLLVVAAGGNAWAWDLKYLAAKWLLAVGLGLIVHQLTGRLSAAALVSLGAPFVGLFVYRINHPAIFSFCYAPWVLYCWLRLARQRDWAGIALWTAAFMGANAVLISSGTVKEAYMLLATLNVSGLIVLLASESDWRLSLRRILGAGVGTVLLALITSPVWLVFLDALRHGYTGYDVPSAFQIQPSMLLGAFDEALYRPLTYGTRVFDPAANFLVLAGLLYFLATLRSQLGNRAAAALGAGSLLPLALAFGLVPPSWIVRVPFLANVAHIDNCFSCALIILWSVLAGVGFSAAADRLGTRDGRADLLIAFLLLFFLVFGFVAFGQAAHKPVENGEAFSVVRPGQPLRVAPFVWAYLGSLILALAGLAALARRSLARGRFTPAAALGVSLCLAVLLWRQGLQPPSVHFEQYTVHPARRADFHARSAAVAFVQDRGRSDPARSIGFRGNLMPGWSDEYGIEEICGPEAISSPELRGIIGASPLRRLWDWRVYLTPADVASCRPVLDFLNVRYYLDVPGDEPGAKAPLRRVFTGDLEVSESPTAWPRAFFTDRVAGYRTPAELIALVARGDGRPFAAVQAADLARSPGLSGMDGALAQRVIVPAYAYNLTESSTSLSVRAPGPGILVVSEVNWPGYAHALLNGEPVALERVNEAFLGVLVPSSGDYELVVRYRPGCASAASGMAAAGWAASALLGGIVLYTRRPARRGP